MFANARIKQCPQRAALLLLVTLVFSGCQTQTQTPTIQTKPQVIGQVTHSTGYPEVIRKNQTYILAAQSRIYLDDILNTDEKSKVHIAMTDGSSFTLGPETHFVFHHYDLDANGDVIDGDMTITSGSLKAKIEAPASRSNIEIKTPQGTIQSVGAEFWSGFSFADNTLDIAMFGGQRMIISNDHGSIQLDQRFWGTSVIGESAPQPAKAWSKQKLAQALAETTL